MTVLGWLVGTGIGALISFFIVPSLVPYEWVGVLGVLIGILFGGCGMLIGSAFSKKSLASY